MSDLSNLAMPSDTTVDDGDFLGGFQVKESGAYPYEIDLAYMGKSAKGATSVNFVFKNGKEELKQTIYVTSGDEKGNLPYYIDKNTGDKRPLPGMNIVNALTFLTLGKQLHELQPEEKLAKLYDYEQRKEVDTKVNVLMDLLGHRIILGLRKQIVDKNVKNANGKYVASGEIREENEIVKVFRASDNKTVAEVKEGDTSAPAEFFTKWATKNTGVTLNKATANPAASGVTAGAPAGVQQTASLF